MSTSLSGRPPDVAPGDVEYPEAKAASEPARSLTRVCTGFIAGLIVRRLEHRLSREPKRRPWKRL